MRIAVDLDGTLAFYDHWRGPEHIGEPVPAMVERVKGWITEGHEVVIFTARVCHLYHRDAKPEHVLDAAKAETAVRLWCIKHIGQALRVTAVKDLAMATIYDDRAIQVRTNEGAFWDIDDLQYEIEAHDDTKSQLAKVKRELSTLEQWAWNRDNVPGTPPFHSAEYQAILRKTNRGSDSDDAVMTAKDNEK